MARPRHLFKRSFNSTLDTLGSKEEKLNISQLGKRVGVSRTTSRQILVNMTSKGIVEPIGHSGYKVIRRPKRQDYFQFEETLSTGEKLEIKFMDWILDQRLGPGSTINEAKLSQEFGYSSTSIREFLLKLSRFGFIRKEPQKHWVLDGFTIKYADDLMAVRMLFEPKAVSQIAEQIDNVNLKRELKSLRRRHVDLLNTIDDNLMEMSGLDTEFHNFINRTVNQHFLGTLQDAISLVFHYQYHKAWNDKQRATMARLALNDHITVIDDILRGDGKSAEKNMRQHLRNARECSLRMLKSKEAD